MANEIKTEELMELGHKARLEGDKDTAIRYYQQAADLSVQDAWYQLGTVYEEMEDYDKAVECYEKQLEEGGTCKYRAYYGLANAYMFGQGKDENFPLALDYYQRAASHGDIDAMVALGDMYLNGEGVAENIDIANYWFDKAANTDGGNAESFLHMGFIYYHGWGKEVDFDKAEEYLQKAVEAGETNALYILGQLYRSKEDYEKALSYYQDAVADSNDFQAAAENDIADMYRFGEGVDQDFQEASEWYKKGAEHGDPDAMCSLGYMYNNGKGVEKNFVKAAYWTLQAAKLGDVVAMFNMGCNYEYGEGVEQDYVAAMAWYKRAADHGNNDAMNCIGDLYYFGNGVDKDYTLAKEWYEKAIMAGNEASLMPLGTIYYYRQDYDKAMELYLKATDEKNKYRHIAEARIGDLYMEGAGVEQDMLKFIEWYKKSAEHGYSTAMLNLGDVYRDGLGIEKDIDEARKWYERAIKAGDDEAEERLADL